MKEQLTFEQYLDRYIPDHKSVSYSGFNDPTEGWWYNWIESGHAETERKERLKSIKEDAIKVQNAKMEQVAYRKTIEVETGLIHLKEKIDDLCNFQKQPSAYEEIVDFIIERINQKEKLQVSKNSVRDYISNK